MRFPIQNYGCKACRSENFSTLQMPILTGPPCKCTVCVSKINPFIYIKGINFADTYCNLTIILKIFTKNKRRQVKFPIIRPHVMLSLMMSLFLS